MISAYSGVGRRDSDGEAGRTNLANFEFVFQCPITISANGQDEAKLRADEWFIAIQQALMEANERLMDRHDVLIIGPAAVVPAKSPSDPAS